MNKPSTQAQSIEPVALKKRHARLKELSESLIAIATNEPHSALKCIHQLSVAGGATHATYLAIEQRIVADQDAAGAYHFALLAQNTPDLPIDARQLIELVIHKGDNAQRLALLKNLPVPPVESIKAQILASADADIIAQMTTYLHINPEAHGSEHILNNAQADSIVPINPDTMNADTIETHHDSK